MESFVLLLNELCDRCPSCLPTFQFAIDRFLSPFTKIQTRKKIQLLRMQHQN